MTYFTWSPFEQLNEPFNQIEDLTWIMCFTKASLEFVQLCRREARPVSFLFIVFIVILKSWRHMYTLNGRLKTIGTIGIITWSGCILCESHKPLDTCNLVLLFDVVLSVTFGVWLCNWPKVFDPCKTVVLGKSQSFWLPEMPLKNKSEIAKPKEMLGNTQRERERHGLVS